MHTVLDGPGEGGEGEDEGAGGVRADEHQAIASQEPSDARPYISAQGTGLPGYHAE